MHNVFSGKTRALAKLLSEKLSVNPLLWSLFAISPADALAYLNLSALGAVMNVPRATAAEDRQQADILLHALRNGTTTPAPNPVVAPHSEAQRERLLSDLIVAPIATRPPASTATAPRTTPPPDVTLNIAKSTIQYALRLYAQQHFIDQSFALPPHPMLDIVARGESIAVELGTDEARISASFDCAATMSTTISGRTFALGTLRTPVDITASAIFHINGTGQLCVGIGQGEIRAPRVPLPIAVLNTLYQRIREALPAVPIVYMPTRLDIPTDPSIIQDEVQVQLSGVRIAPEAVTLEFQLFFSPASHWPA